MGYLMTRQSFQCNRYCGKCCKNVTVRLSKKDIKRIKRLGYKEEEFLEKDPMDRNKFNLKKNRENCVFLKQNKGKYICSIHESRPEICRQYPFFGKAKSVKSCYPEDMQPNAFFFLKKGHMPINNQ